MKRLSCLVFIVFVSLCTFSNLWAKNYWYESLSPGTTVAVSGTTTFSGTAFKKYVGTKIYGYIKAVYSIETLPVRVRWDGVSPTSDEGLYLAVNDVLVLESIEDIRNFKVIGTEGTATTKCIYSEEAK